MYSWDEFDMDNDRWNLLKCIPPIPLPRRYDRFIIDNTIYDYEQMLCRDEVIISLIVKKPNSVRIFKLGSDKDDSLITDYEIIYTKFLDFIENNELEPESIWNVVRDNTSIQQISNNGYIIKDTYPTVQILGLPYGLNSLKPR